MAPHLSFPSRAQALCMFQFFLVLAIWVLCLGETAIAQTPPTPRYSGRWSVPKEWDGTALHLMLLPGNPNGSPASHSKILWWGGSSYSTIEGELRLWQTTADTTCSEVSNDKFVHKELTTPGFNVFCSGHGHLADGRLLVTGGTSIGEIGIRNSSIFDPSTDNETWTMQPDMTWRRWYPSTTPLPDGRVMVGSGSMFFPIYVFGGSSTASGSAPSDNLYRLGLTESGDWLALTQIGTPGVNRPAARTGHTEVAENPSAQRWVFGGRKADGITYFNDTWIPNYELATLGADYTYGWLPRHSGSGTPGVDVPNGRMQHVAAVLSDNSLIVFGGFGKDGSGQDKVFEDVWRLRFFNGQWTWQQLNQSPLPGQAGHPGARFAHAAVNDAARSRILVFGGAMNPQQTLADDEVYALSINAGAGTATWSKPVLRTSTKPASRMGHPLALDPVIRDRDPGPLDQKVMSPAYWTEAECVVDLRGLERHRRDVVHGGGSQPCREPLGDTRRS